MVSSGSLQKFLSKTASKCMLCGLFILFLGQGFAEEGSFVMYTGNRISPNLLLATSSHCQNMPSDYPTLDPRQHSEVGSSIHVAHSSGFVTDAT